MKDLLEGTIYLTVSFMRDRSGKVGFVVGKRV